LGTTVAVLERLANSGDTYKLWTTDAARDVQQPVPELQRLHGRVHLYLSRVEVPDYLHSPVKHRSYVTNARVHAGAAPSVKIDIRKFFQSVPRTAVYRFFLDEMKCAGDVSAMLAKLLTYGDFLPTGSSSSPIIAYYAFRNMFDEIASFARQSDLVLTCYVDDLTLTGAASLGDTIKSLQQIIGRYGLRSHKVKMFAAGKAKIITGVVVEGSSVKLPNKRHKAIADGFDELDQTTGPAERLRILNRLVSRLHEAGMIEPTFKARARTLELERSQTRREAMLTVSVPIGKA